MLGDEGGANDEQELGSCNQPGARRQQPEIEGVDDAVASRIDVLEHMAAEIRLQVQDVGEGDRAVYPPLPRVV